MQNLVDDLKVLLQKDERLVVDSKLQKDKIIELVLRLDPALIKRLLSQASIKKHFFQEVEKVLVFDKIKFQEFISSKNFLSENHTSLKNKIGLLNEQGFISEAKGVVLGWPHKDCVLEGGQTKEEVKLEKVFWDETLMPEDIDLLFSDKVLTNFKRYTKEGARQVSEIDSADNLVIKGNNLFVLHSLKKRFAGRIKLIYLDPPYNTGSDGFRYNDNFSQSTWLTFIKNRIEVAKELLGQDGFLFVHISFHQFAYLKVLLDEIFEGNHVCTFNLLVRHPNRILKGDKDFHDVIEYLLVYTKNKVANKIAKRLEATDIDNYVYQIEELNEGHTVEINGSQIQYFKPGDYKVTKGIPSSGNLQKISIRGSLKEGNSSGRFYEKNLAPIKGKFPPNTVFKILNMGRDKFDHRYFYTPEEGKSNGGYFQGVPIDNKEFKEKPYPNFLDFVQDFNNVGYEGNVEFRNGKKPEFLLKKVFELGKVKKGDIVLDFFLGSGTTAAVAHKMGIQYIGVEQMDYGDNDSVKRLASVIAGEPSGISESVDWKGGGGFIYCELKKCIDTQGNDQHYINYSEIDNTDYEMDENTKQLNHQFYKSVPKA